MKRSPRLPHALKRLAGNRRGNVAIIGAVSIPLLLGAAAIGIDWGYLGYQKRDAQADTDLAAISAAANLGAARTAIGTYLANNGLAFKVASESDQPGSSRDAAAGKGLMTYALGHYDASASQMPGARFVVGATPYNAVRVRLVKRGEITIAGAFTSPPWISTEAIAGTNGIAAFSIGSRLASLNGGIVNALLGKLLGTTVSLDAMDYRSLLDADVNALSFLDSVATHLHLQADDYKQILATQLSIGQFLDAMADTKGLSGSVRTLLGRMADSTSGSDDRSVPLGKLLDLGELASLGPGDGDAAISANAGVLDMISAAAAVANGDHQIALDVGAGIPGLTKLAVALSIGEPPAQGAWFAIGGAGTIARTAQTRLKIEATIGGSGLLSGIQIKLPIYLEVANAAGKITGVECTGASSSDATVDVSARPGVVEAWIGDLDDDAFSRLSSTGNMQLDPAKLLDVKALGLSVDATAHAAVTNVDADTLSFSPRDIREGTVHSVSTRDFTSTLIGSLLGNLKLGVHLGGLSLLTPTLVQKALAKTLSAATEPLDSALYNVLLTLGIRLGEADVRVTGVKCDRPVLVQ